METHGEFVLRAGRQHRAMGRHEHILAFEALPPADSITAR